MRLTEQQVIGGLRHESILVRQPLLNYFEDCLAPPQEFTRAFIDVVESHGWSDAFRWSHQVDRCPHDDQSMIWCLDQLDELVRSPEASLGSLNVRPFHLVSWANTAPASLLSRHYARIACHPAFQKSQLNELETAIEKVDRRIAIASLDPEQAWQKLTKHCHSVAKVSTFANAKISIAKEWLEPIVAARDSFHDRILDVLSDTNRDHDGSHGWMVGFMIMLSGRLRLSDSLPHLLEKFALDWDWYNEEISTAISFIGTPAAHQQVIDYYSDRPWYVRNYLSGPLENIHYDGAAEAISALLPVEKDEDLRVQLAAAMTAQFDDFAIEPARKIYQEDPQDPERGVMIENLFALAKVAEIDLPEADSWERTLEREWNRQSEKMLDPTGPLSAIGKLVMQGHERSEDDPSDTHETVTSSRADVAEPKPRRIGRNDSCPCGSGKKYKKCCLRTSQVDSFL